MLWLWKLCIYAVGTDFPRSLLFVLFRLAFSSLVLRVFCGLSHLPRARTAQSRYSVVGSTVFVHRAGLAEGLGNLPSTFVDCLLLARQRITNKSYAKVRVRAR